MEKRCYCQYENGPFLECGVGVLKFYIPKTVGYTLYTLVHSVNEKENCDVWRLGVVFSCDDAFENVAQVTLGGAEWDMALKLWERPDFIGGYAHGDERMTQISFAADGKPIELPSLEKRQAFERFQILESSVGFDPNDHSTPVLVHKKDFRIDSQGISLGQTVQWLGSYRLGASYMAMMPPMKALTDSYYTDLESVPQTIRSGDIRIPGCKKAVVFGAQSGLRFSMEMAESPELTGGNAFLLTDNGGRAYNKMYFVLCNGAEASKGDVWKTETVYRIF